MTPPPNPISAKYLAPPVARAGDRVFMRWDPLARNWVDHYGRHWEQTSFDQATGVGMMMPLAMGVRSRKRIKQKPDRSTVSEAPLF